MSSINAKVLKVLKEPYFKGSNWIVEVEADVSGETREVSIYCLGQERAKRIKEGHIFPYAKRD